MEEEKKTIKKTEDEKKVKKEEIVKAKKETETKVNVEKESEEKKATEVNEKVKKQPEKKKIKVKDIAIVNGVSIRVSSKDCFSICKAIKGKRPEDAINFLEDVIKQKRAVRMANREVPHQKSRGEKNIAGARFPKNASVAMIDLIKQLKSNVEVNGIENAVIAIAKANKASRPFKREGRKAKRTHIYLEARDKTKLKKKLKKKENGR